MDYLGAASAALVFCGCTAAMARPRQSESNFVRVQLIGIAAYRYQRTSLQKYTRHLPPDVHIPLQVGPPRVRDDHHEDNLFSRKYHGKIVSDALNDVLFKVQVKLSLVFGKFAIFRLLLVFFFPHVSVC